jgi:hypothetical protein
VLVISFSFVLAKMARGKLEPEELDDAVFYVGATRSGVFDMELGRRELWWARDIITPERADEIIHSFQEAILKAEAAGRAVYRTKYSGNTWQQLNGLLVSLGLPPSEPVDNDWPEVDRYNYPAVHQAVEEQGLPYRVLG